MSIYSSRRSSYVTPIIVLIILCTLLFVKTLRNDYYARENREEITQLNHQVSRLQTKCEKLKQQNDKLQAAVNRHSEQFSKLQVSRGERIRSMGTFRCSAYTANDPGMTGNGRVAGGGYVQEWSTVAVDPSVIPMYSKVYIPYFKDYPNHGIFEARDTGGSIKGARIDIYMTDRGEALQFGKRDLEVYLIN